ncbi:MAG TPA: aldo/keto reductase, partial [Candidatus Binatia bacterium]|nr:aldo/keto reductase [Candidatus Binatia bacterium]
MNEERYGRYPDVEAHGAKIPAIGLGTWQLSGETCTRAVIAALECGYRHVDTAKMYGNESEVGDGLRSAGVARDEIFVTTKAWRDDLHEGDLQRSAEANLKRLGLDKLDLLLIHWPNRNIPLKESIKALCETRARGLTRHIGVSNFPVVLLEQALAVATEPIVTNQCEYHRGSIRRKCSLPAASTAFRSRLIVRSAAAKALAIPRSRKSPSST